MAGLSLKQIFKNLVANIKHEWIGILISVCALIFTIYYSHNSRVMMTAQNSLFLKQIELTIAPSIDVHYELKPEAIVLKNTGIHDIKDVSILFTHYFVFNNGNAYTIQGLQQLIKDNPKLLDSINKTALLLNEDIINIFPGKDYSDQNKEPRTIKYSLISKIQGEGKLPIPSFYISNFVLLAQALNCKLVIGCDIEYFNSINNAKFSLAKLFLVEPNLREDLETILGGQKVKKDIENLRSATTGEIFH
jgi:hypothetical protein